MTTMHRRDLLRGLCSCSLLGLTACVSTQGAEPPLTSGYRPATATDEGGLWHIMDKAENDIKRSRYLIRDAEWQAYLRDIVGRLSPDFASDMRIYLVRTPYFNASMAPNGMMQVWTGLLVRVDNEAELAAVLGHEIGHYMQRHSLAKLRDMRARSDAALFLGLGLAMAGVGAAGSLANLALVAGHFSFNREQEREADEIGLQLLTRAGYRPLAASEVWQQLVEESKADPNPKNPSVLFATHPSSDERMNTLRDKAKDGGDKGETYAERYRERLRSVRFMLLEDELRLRQYERSLVMLKRLQDETPGDGELIYFEAEVYRLRDQDDDRKVAEDTYGRAVQAANPPPQAWRSLGLLQRRDGRHEAAQQSFRKYLDLKPDAEDRAIIASYMEKSA
jgi:predicted Zn-dependent protease